VELDPTKSIRLAHCTLDTPAFSPYRTGVLKKENHCQATALVDHSESVSRHEDEEHNQADADQHCKEQDHQGSLVHELANVGFADARPVHEGIFAEACESEDRVDGVLLRREGIDTDREWEYKLRGHD